MTLLVLACTFFWGSALLLTLSDQYAASDDMVKHEQSRLLAKSGWNLAIKQLEEDGTQEDFRIEKTSGNAVVQFQQQDENQIHIVSSAVSNDYPSVVEGMVHLLELPWRETADWQISETLQDATQPGIFCSAEEEFILNTSITQPIALTSIENNPVTVSICEPLYCSMLFIHGDLIIEDDGFLEADAVYVSGQITGRERIAGNIVLEQYATGIDYHVQAVERLA